MKNAIVRFVSLYVFNVAVLLLIGLLMTNVRVGWNALWASVILTLAALFVKPALAAVFRRSAAKSASNRTSAREKVVQYALVYVVELIIWVLTVWLSGVSVAGFFWGYVLPPLGLLLGWVIYDQIDDRLHAKASEVYDTVQARVQGSRPSSATPAPESPQTSAARAELNDGLTAEQRRMLDEL